MTNPTQLYKVLPGGLTCREVSDSSHWKYAKGAKDYPLTEPMEEGKFQGVEVKYYQVHDDPDNTTWYRVNFGWQEDYIVNNNCATKIKVQPVKEEKEVVKDERVKKLFDDIAKNGIPLPEIPLQAVDANKEVESQFEGILNKQFEPNSETPLWACIALSSDKDAYLNAMQKAYELGKQSQSVESIVGFVLEYGFNKLANGWNGDIRTLKADIIKELKNGK